MLQIHFTPGDLSTVRLADCLDPMWEVALGARALQSRTPLREISAWRQSAAPSVGVSMRPIFELVSATGGFPDFLTPVLTANTLEEGVASMLETRPQQIRSELAVHFPAPSAWQQRLAGGSMRAKRELGHAVQEFHRHALNPIARDRTRWLSADRARWTRQVADGGVAPLLSGLMRGMRWEPPVLVYGDCGGSGLTEVFLGGRGLTVYPTRFTREPLVLDLPDRRPILVVRGSGELLDEAVVAPLSELLGRTRAAVLMSLVEPASTTELAGRIAISLASASEHARVLRGSGLIATQRMSQSVLHTLTPLGRQFISR